MVYTSVLPPEVRRHSPSLKRQRYAVQITGGVDQVIPSQSSLAQMLPAMRLSAASSSKV